MPLQNHPADLCTLAIEIAHGAGDILRTHAQHARTIDLKSTATDMVTDADKASEQFIVDAIRNRRPDDGIVGEEGTNVESKSGYSWIVDPLDGTTNFVYSIPSYAASIGLLHDGQPLVGAVYNPILDEMYSAYVGGGAFLNGRPIHANHIETLAMALVATGFSYDAEQRGKNGKVAGALLPHIRDLRRMGAAALDLCNVASGRADAYYEYSVQPWDVTAGIVIATEAGAKVTSIDGTGPANTSVLAAPQPIYDLLLEELAEES